MNKPTIEKLYPDEINQALKACGQYVYAYYEKNAFQPFYVGKGTGSRALAHWKKAIENPEKEHEIKINEMLKAGIAPQIKLLAYNLELANSNNRDEKTYSIVERVLQDAFGIQKVINKTAGGDRIEKIKATLLQTREDSAKYPTLSLDAVIAKYAIRKTLSQDDLKAYSQKTQTPILLVGLSKTYHPKYDFYQLGEMSRKYWNLDKFENTTLPRLKMNNAILLAWASIDGRPMIVGAWGIDSKNSMKNSNDRHEFNITDFTTYRKEFLGLGLLGKGNNWQGQHIFTP